MAWGAVPLGNFRAPPTHCRQPGAEMGLLHPCLSEARTGPRTGRGASGEGPLPWHLLQTTPFYPEFIQPQFLCSSFWPRAWGYRTRVKSATRPSSAASPEAGAPPPLPVASQGPPYKLLNC